MTRRTARTALSIIVVLAAVSALRAQKTKPPTLTEILGRLESNLNHYDSSVPSLFCEEHVVSSRTELGLPAVNTTTDSIFRLKRVARPGPTTALVESREVRTVDGKPATSQHIDGPALLSGVFEGGLAIVSLSQSRCMYYELQRPEASGSTAPYLIRFGTQITPGNAAGCLLHEKSKGKVLIDPASMQIQHLEMTTPRHVMIDGDAFSPPVVGNRQLTVDYAPVLLGGETFWMPSVITMRITSGFGFHRTVWSFRATYSDYHRMKVTSRIVPGSEAPAH